MKALVIKQGYIDVPIQDEKGNSLGVVSFNPKDINMLDRIKKGFDRIEEKIKVIENLDNLDEESQMEKYKDCDSFVKSELDSIFDADVSNVLFGNNSCFSAHNGEYWILQFLIAITPIIQSEVKKEVEKSGKRVSKYTERYIK